MTKRRTKRRPDSRSKRRRPKRRAKRFNPAILIIALIFIIGGYLGFQMVRDGSIENMFFYNNDKADLKNFFDISDDKEVAIVIGDEILDEKARLIDGAYYMDYPSVQKYINSRFYYGMEDETITYTTPTTIITANVGETGWTDSDGGSGDEGYVIAKVENDNLYLALDYVKKYTNFAYTAYKDPNRIELFTSWDEQQVATVARNTKLRVKGGPKSEVLEDLKKGQSVVVLEEFESWYKVKSEDAFIGFVEKKKVKDKKAFTPEPVTDYEEPEYTKNIRDHKINLAFHNIGAASANSHLEKDLEGTHGINAIAPMWLRLDDNSGKIDSIASSEYVEKAHAAGLEVWPILNNLNMREGVFTYETLCRAESRANLINEAIEAVKGCGADGVNVDFEGIDEKEAVPLVEFIRELSIACRKEGLVLSVDDPVPLNNLNTHMNFKEQGIVADYVIMMGYDERTKDATDAGSVASLGFVEEGLKNLSKEVDPSQLINAVPLYTRIWHTSADGSFSNEVAYRENMQKFIDSNNVKLIWDGEVGQNYGEYTDSNGNFSQIWVEDAKSLEAKINVMKQYEIGGIAEWSIGIGKETDDVWDVIAEFIEG
ncbi:MAG: chitinase [Butyrivibrio sp.]|nr:chitinase [Butyrivibrio sp.]